MLKSIEISGIATYDSTGIAISDLQKINFIYGPNGSGKTTLSNLIAEPASPEFVSSKLSWKGAPLQTLVYNKRFREANFRQRELKGVFTLGKASKEQIDEIEKLKVDQTEIKTQGEGLRVSLEKLKAELGSLEDDFKEKAWHNLYKRYEIKFKEAFRGTIASKDAFKSKVLQFGSVPSDEGLTLIALEEKAKVLFGERPQTLSSVSGLVFSQISEIEDDKIWTKKIVGKADVDIARLIQRLNMNDWVNEGRSFLEEGETCPFCQQQTVTTEFRKQLEEYFDESFAEDSAHLKAQADAFNLQAQNILGTLTLLETTQEGMPESKLNLDRFRPLLKTLEALVFANRELIQTKIKEPSRSIQLKGLKPQLLEIQDIIQAANQEISKHNELVKNFDSEYKAMVKAVWKYILEENILLISEYQKRRDNLEKGIKAINEKGESVNKEWLRLDREIKEKGKNVTSVQPTVNEINRILRFYGFTNFQIMPSPSSKNYYQIQRENGEYAEETLSEGEITFITFLYFWHLCKGSITEENISDDRILVVDDPISSLDSNILFVVCTLLKSIMKDIREGNGNIKQIILLTHNVYFHKEVSFADGGNSARNDRSFWVLRRNKKITSIEAFGQSNPISSSYELLWKEVKNRHQISGINLQNTYRRILEHYFQLLGRTNTDKLIESFSTFEEQTICRSMISWINEGSHTIPEDLYVEHPESQLEQYFEVFKAVYAQMGHDAHFNMMMGLEAN